MRCGFGYWWFGVSLIALLNLFVRYYYDLTALNIATIVIMLAIGGVSFGIADALYRVNK